MMAIKPKNNDSMIYILLGSQRNEYTYILPDGRLCTSSDQYFDAPIEIDLNHPGICPAQLESFKLDGLPLSFILFLVALQNKVRAIPNFHPLLAMAKQAESGPSANAKPKVLGGKAKIWLQTQITIDDTPYHLEVHRSCHVDSLRDFMEGIFAGCKPKAYPVSKTKIQIMLDKDETFDKNLHIFLERVGQ